MKENQKIVIIDYGAGNIKSVKFALERLGVEAILSSDKQVIENADKVIFPGVGRAKAAMDMLVKNDLQNFIPKLKQPVLGVCLGMQLMCEHTEEDNIDALGIFPITVKKFSSEVKVPQIGWNQVADLKSNIFKSINNNSYCYFVHSYYIPDNKYSIATTFYDIEYSSAIKKDNFYATQFHPEKSGDIGEQILKNFIELS